MFDVVAMPMDWPAEVVYHEAKAFCRWKGDNYRLPTEAECHVIRGLQTVDSHSSSSPEETDPICLETAAEAYNFAFHYGSTTVGCAQLLFCVFEIFLTAYMFTL